VGAPIDRAQPSTFPRSLKTLWWLKGIDNLKCTVWPLVILIGRDGRDELALFQDMRHALFQIQGIEVKSSWQSRVVHRSPQLLNDFGDHVHSDLLHQLIVPFDSVEPPQNSRRKLRMAQLCNSPQNLIALHRHETRYDGHVRHLAALPSHHGFPSPISGNVVEQLGHDKVRAGLDLLDEKGQVLLGILARGVRMALVAVALGIGGDADAEPIPVRPPHVPDQIDGVVELAVRIVGAVQPLRPVLFAARWIPPQAEYVAYPEHFGFLERLIYERPRHVGARQVQTGGQAQLPLA
jgi:hypothetical protein